MHLERLSKASNGCCGCDLRWKLVPDPWANNRKRPAPAHLSRPAGTKRSDEEDDLSRFRLDKSQVTLDARYGGAISLRHLKTKSAALNSILRSIPSQWSSLRMGVMWSYLCFLITSLAAALTTDCRRRVRVLGSPTRTELQ